MLYRELLSEDVNANFSLFVSSRPASTTSTDDVAATIAFFIVNFGDSEFDPGSEEDDVIEFCQFGPAGNYGRQNSVEEIASSYPGYTQAIEDAINDSWESLL